MGRLMQVFLVVEEALRERRTMSTTTWGQCRIVMHGHSVRIQPSRRLIFSSSQKRYLLLVDKSNVRWASVNSAIHRSLGRGPNQTKHFNQFDQVDRKNGRSRSSAPGSSTVRSQSRVQGSGRSSAGTHYGDGFRPESQQRTRDAINGRAQTSNFSRREIPLHRGERGHEADMDRRLARMRGDASPEARPKTIGSSTNRFDRPSSRYRSSLIGDAKGEQSMGRGGSSRQSRENGDAPWKRDRLDRFSKGVDSVGSAPNRKARRDEIIGSFRESYDRQRRYDGENRSYNSSRQEGGSNGDGGRRMNDRPRGRMSETNQSSNCYDGQRKPRRYDDGIQDWQERPRRPYRQSPHDEAPFEGQRTDDTPPQLRSSSNMPISVPFTTAASEFLYGTSVVQAALQSRQRELYKLYIYTLSGRKDDAKDAQLTALAKVAKVDVVRLSENESRLMDKMSKGRPHNVGRLILSPSLARVVAFLSNLCSIGCGEGLYLGSISDTENARYWPRETRSAIGQIVFCF